MPRHSRLARLLQWTCAMQLLAAAACFAVHAASIVGKCHFCVRSHYKLLKENGMTAQQLRDVGRIAAVVTAAANALAIEG